MIHDDIYGVFENGIFVRIFDLDMERHRGTKGKLDVRIVYPKHYHPKGSFKDSYIEMEDGRQYPSSITRSYQDYFEKL